MRRVWFALERFFVKTLACRIDAWPSGLRVRWYNLTGRIGGFFHRRNCASCRAKLAWKRQRRLLYTD